MKSLLATSALMIAMTGWASAQDRNIELRFSSWVPPTHGMHDAVKLWSESIAKDSGGTISVTLYPAEQLGKANDHYDMARDGIADITYLQVGYQAGRFPVAEAVHLPLLLDNADGGSMAFDEWYRQYAPKEMSEVKYCLGFVHDPGTIHSKKEIRKPTDLAGMKVRSAHATMANFVSLLGGTNVRVSAPESRAALESGVADAITFPWESVRLFGIDNVVTHSMNVKLYVSGFAWVMNKDVIDSMSESQKAVMDKHCSVEWAGEVGRTWGAFEAKGREELAKKQGYTVYDLTSEEVHAWKDAANPLLQKWAEGVKSAGIADPDATMADFKAKLKARNSLVE